MRITAEEVRRIDQKAIREYAIPGLLLMENAGRSVSEVIFRCYKPCKVLIFAGKGNNGGDGLVVARHLANRGFPVQIILLEDPAKLKADSLLNFDILCRMKASLVPMTDASEDEFFGYTQNSDLVVDAIFGVGIRGPVSGVFENAIRAVNRSGKQVISIDVPSGLDADTGQVRGVAVKATRTVTLALPKIGLYEGAGPGLSGEIEVVDIGLPRELLQPFLTEDGMT